MHVFLYRAVCPCLRLQILTNPLSICCWPPAQATTYHPSTGHSWTGVLMAARDRLQSWWVQWWAARSFSPWWAVRPGTPSHAGSVWRTHSSHNVCVWLFAWVLRPSLCRPSCESCWHTLAASNRAGIWNEMLVCSGRSFWRQKVFVLFAMHGNRQGRPILRAASRLLANAQKEDKHIIGCGLKDLLQVLEVLRTQPEQQREMMGVLRRCLEDEAISDNVYAIYCDGADADSIRHRSQHDVSQGSAPSMIDTTRAQRFVRRRCS